MTTNDVAAAALDAVRAANRPDADAELKRRIRAALDLGHSEVRVAEAAGISRVTQVIGLRSARVSQSCSAGMPWSW